MKRHVIAVILAVGAFSAGAAAQQAGVVEVLDGTDPVLLVQGKDVLGKADLKVVRGRFAYLFSTPETKAAFEADPAKYEVQMNGACARMGPGVGGNPSDFAVVDGRIYLFGSDDCHKKFVAAPAKFLPREAPPMPTAARDLQQGQALIERAVTALGGAAAVDAVTAYAETTTQVQKRPTGDVPVVTKTTWVFATGVRTERSMTLQGNVATSGMLVNREGAWFIDQRGGSHPQNPVARATTEQELGRQLIPLLHNRRDPAFKAAAVGTAVVGGTPVDRVRIQNGAVDVTLGIEPASGRIHSLEFTGRNMEAEIGAYALVYGDYRQVDGLTLPFQVRALFDGAPDPFRSTTLDAIAVNPPVDAALFASPKGEAR
jgi:YHS domain-containing protein